jgi:hypothetical protein
LWQYIRPDIDDFDCEEILNELVDLALVERNVTDKMLTLHDLLHSYTREKLGSRLVLTHNDLLASYRLAKWADLPPTEPYLWDHLAYHLIQAGREAELLTTVKDLHYLANKVQVRNAYAAKADLAAADNSRPHDMALRLLQRHFANMIHVLNRCTSHIEIVTTLYNHLQHRWVRQMHPPPTQASFEPQRR